MTNLHLKLMQYAVVNDQNNIMHAFNDITIANNKRDQLNKYQPVASYVVVDLSKIAVIDIQISRTLSPRDVIVNMFPGLDDA